jgi:ubiquinone/menaquinone biosynthesis C-methylase UbiE
MTSEQELWQLDGDTPELYERYLVPAITSLWAADLINRAAPQPTDRVLDIACGTGAVTRLAADRVTTGRVVGLDLNPGMLKVARSIRTSSASEIEWYEGSAQDLPFSNHPFDLVLCQLGLQFFPDRPRAVREMKRVLVPAGRLALSVYSAIEQTPAEDAFARALDHHFGPDASSTKRAEHVFRDRDELSNLIARQGFEDVTVSIVTMTIGLPSVEDYVRFQLLATPMAGLLSTLDPQARDQAIEATALRTKAFLDPEHTRDDQFTFPQEAYVVCARCASRRVQ